MTRFQYTVSIIFTIMTMVFVSGTAHAISITTSPAQARVNQPVTFNINFGFTNCMTWVDYGEGAGLQYVGTPSGTTLSVTHTYTKAGLYTFTVQTASCNPTPPNPASITVKVSDFRVTRLELAFENNRPEITIQRNAPGPKLKAKIKYAGMGFLKGYWEVDGFKRHQVFKRLHAGHSIEVPYPAIPSLPTFTPGSHRVRFVITNPEMNITFPTAIYFVETREHLAQSNIHLIYPSDKATLPFEPLNLSWKPSQQAVLYLVSMYTEKEGEPVFNAYTKRPSYRPNPALFSSRFLPEKEYYWQVSGFNKDNDMTAQSKKRKFYLDKATEWVPGHILFVTKRTPMGDRAVKENQDAFNLTIIEQYDIETLDVRVTLFSSARDITEIIPAIKIENDIVMVQPDYIFKTNAEPLSSIQGLDSLLPTQLIQGQLTGHGVRVGIVDTGIESDHQDLKDAIAYSQNFISGKRTSGEIHGTAVAGVIGARRNDFGIRGIAPGVSLIELRACRQISSSNPAGECYSNTLIKAIDAGIRQNARIINLSLGTSRKDPLMSSLIEAGAKKGVLFVAPAGNRPDIKSVSFPASHTDVICVAGKSPKGRLFPNPAAAGRSDFLAPYQNLFTTVPGNTHNYISGTSMSAAFVSGVIALSLEHNPAFGPEDLKDFKGDLDALIQRLIPEDE